MTEENNLEHREIFDAQGSIFDQRAASFDKLSWVLNRDFLGAIFAEISEFVHAYRKSGREAKRYLDVGTGTGEVLRYLSGTTYTQEQGLLTNAIGVGLDVSKNMIKLASQKLSNIPRIELVNGSIMQNEFEDKSFDFIVCRNAFHHFSDPGLALKEMERLVKPNGRIFLIEGVAPDNFTLAKWKDILLLRDTGRNPDVLLSQENIAEFFRRLGTFPRKTVSLTAIPMLVSNWLSNALISADTRDEIMTGLNRLSKNPEFSERFWLLTTKKFPEAEKDYEFKKRSMLVELIV